MSKSASRPGAATPSPKVPEEAFDQKSASGAKTAPSSNVHLKIGPVEFDGPLPVLLLVFVAALVGFGAGVAVIVIRPQAAEVAKLALGKATMPGAAVATQSAAASSTPSPAPVVLPANLLRRLDFENGLTQAASLGVCDASVEPWQSHCHDALGRLAVSARGFGSDHSAQVRFELLPDRPQVYSVRLPLEPTFADSVDAEIYVPDPGQFSALSLAAHLRGTADSWVFSKLTPKQAGWNHVTLDLQQFRNADGTAVAAVGIDQLHVDLFAPKSQGQAEDTVVLIDAINFYAPASRADVFRP